MPWEALRHAMPLAQHMRPHGVVFVGQQHEFAGSVHTPPDRQHPCPHTAEPDGQVTAALWNGRRTAAPAAATAVAPSSFNAPRRDVDPAIAFDSPSNRSVIARPLESQPPTGDSLPFSGFAQRPLRFFYGIPARAGRGETYDRWQCSWRAVSLRTRILPSVLPPLRVSRP